MKSKLQKKALLQETQRSILEFTRKLNANEMVEEIENRNKVIDLTIEHNESQVEVLLKEEEIQEIEAQLDGVECPICGVCLDTLAMDVRALHVETCLKIGENEAKKEEDLGKEHVDKTAGRIRGSERLSISHKTTPALGNKARTRKAIPHKEKYINKASIIEIKEKPKIARPPKTLSVIRQRPPIPDVKILSFRKYFHQTLMVAVDAFSYAKQETINMYFLSHFHSDHYGGISKKWCYERLFEAEDDLEDESKMQKLILCTPITARLLNLRFLIDFRFMNILEYDHRYLVKDYASNENVCVLQPDRNIPGLYVTAIAANHCPGSAIFLFESSSLDEEYEYVLHCGDFRVSKDMFTHPSLSKFLSPGGSTLDKVYLDTTYFTPSYNFPKQETICESTAMFLRKMLEEKGEKADESLYSKYFGIMKQSRITDYLRASPSETKKKVFLILVGTYLIGKEKLAISILKCLKKCPIFVLQINSRKDKREIIDAFEDEYLESVLSEDDIGSSESNFTIHLVPMSIVNTQEEMLNYYNHNRYYDYFENCIGIRPTGWSFDNKDGNIPSFLTNSDQESIDFNFPQFCEWTIDLLEKLPPFVLHEEILSSFTASRKPTKRQKFADNSCRILSVPYSEHSSFRELAYFIVLLNIREVIPTVNIGNEYSRNRMSSLIKKFERIRSLRINGQDNIDCDIDSSLMQRLMSLNGDSI